MNNHSINKASDDQNHPVCINLDKVLQITEIISDFNNDETENLKSLLLKMSKLSRCDKIAYLQPDTENATETVISFDDSFKESLLKDNSFEIILDFAKNIKYPIIIDSKHELNQYYEIDNFDVIAPVILHNEIVGCIIASYEKGTLGSGMFQSCDLSHYQLVANIISIQENSYRTKIKLQQSLQHRKILNDLAEKLLKTKNKDMDQYINECIEVICKNWNIDRGYLFLTDFKNNKLIKTNEWCNHNVASLLEAEKSISMNEFPWQNIVDFFVSSPTSVIHIPNIYNEIEEILEKFNLAREEKNKTRKQLDVLIKEKQLKSVLLIPISDSFNNNIYTLAILGFSQVGQFKTFSSQMIEMLNIMSSYLTEAVKRRKEYINRNQIDDYVLDNILKWKAESEENDKKFRMLQDKLKSISAEYHENKSQ